MKSIGVTHPWSAARAAYVAGFAMTSNLEAGRRHGIPTAGTSAHAFTLAHRTEVDRLVPLVDLLMAVFRRVKAGRSPFAPDKMHLHHRLLEIGHSHRRAVLLIYFWSALLAFGGVAMSIVEDPLPVLSVVAALAAVAIVLSIIPRLRTSRRAS